MIAVLRHLTFSQGDLMKKQKGFSLIELLIVVAIILIIAAIAIPNLLKSRIAANEASAVGTVRTINTAEVTYNNSCQQYANGIGELNTGTVCAAGANIIDSTLATGLKSGYKFVVIAPGTTAAGTIITTFDVNADPQTASVTGVRHFFSNESLVIRVDPAAPATNASNPL
jgi:type IV pilus assembly protein PilA